MTSSYIFADKNTGDDRLSIQNALDLAKQSGFSTVVLDGGVWKVDSTLLIHEDTRLILDGATLTFSEGFGGIILRNSNSVKPYNNSLFAVQEHIVISAKNGGKITGGSVLLSNVSYSILENLEFVDCENFAVIFASVMGIKCRSISFNRCANGFGLGVGTRDCIFTGINGNVESNLFVMSDYLYEDLRRYHRDFKLLNNIVRNVDVTAKSVAYLCGCDIERTVFTEIKATVSNPAFVIKQGKHITISKTDIKGKLLNHNDDNKFICILD